MVVGIRRRAVGVFSRHENVEKALHELKHSGFAMDRVSVIVQDKGSRLTNAEQQMQEQVDESMKLGVISGGVLGGLGGLLVGLATLVIPGIGLVMLAGATAATIASTLAGASIGAVAGGLIGALISLGIPEEKAQVYEERLQQGHYLVIIDGTDAEIAQAEVILHRCGVEEYGIYNSKHDKSVTTTAHQYALGYFALLQDAEAGINDLRSAGFPLQQISLIHREPVERESLADIQVSDRLNSTQWIIPNQRDRFYNERINQGDYIVTVSGTDTELQRATNILHRHDIQQWQLFEPNTTLSPGESQESAVMIIDHREEKF